MHDDRLIETLRGAGLVTTESGGQIGVRHYAFQHWRTVQITTSINGIVSENEVSQKMTGVIHWNPDDVRQHLGETWTITLADGRRQSFLLKSSRGEIAFTGPCE